MFSTGLWNYNTLKTNLTNENLVNMFPFIITKTQNKRLFADWIKRIENFVDATIDSIITCIPSTWGLNEDEKTMLSQFVKNRRFLVGKIVNSS
jgi:hypothetical protein